MVNFKGKREFKGNDSKINPLDIYDSLDRKADKGPLRDVQKEILLKWFESFQINKDVILKLHTGQGKTIIGLLILQSKLNQGLGPCLYLCPSPYLVDQTCAQADSFGIKYCVIDDSKEIPNEFIDGKTILITFAQKLFNGLTKFGINTHSIEVNSIILDDAHACAEVIRDSFKIKSKSDEKLYQKLLDLFDDDLSKQQAGTLSDIKDGEYDALMAVPYWSWNDKIDSVLQVISEHKEEVKFGWSLLKNILQECICIFSGASMEIYPYNLPLEIFGSYFKAQHRVFMSATLNDDSFFVNGLGLDEETILKPLKIDNEKWSGEKLILLPSQIDDSFDRSKIVKLFGDKRGNPKYGIVAMVPSKHEGLDWEAQGALMPPSKANEFKKTMDFFLSGEYSQTLVLVNRYDGIDLPDNHCRVLVLCSVPFAGTLEERYISNCRASSEQILLKTAQSIEQGLGRGVRGEKDFCCILLVGTNLIKLIKSSKTKKFFSEQTQKQIEIGIGVSKDVEKEIQEGTSPDDALLGLMNQQLVLRDEEWKDYYAEEMKKLTNKKKENNVLKTLLLERRAYLRYKNSDIEGAAKILQTIIDSADISDEERGWYLQEIARYYYSVHSKEKSNVLQNSAHKLNYNLFKPFQGYVPKKLSLDSVARNEKIMEYISGFENYFDLRTDIDLILGNIAFEATSENFEKGIEDLGKILGYESIRPDKENNEGPDNLWKIDDRHFLVIECKNHCDPNRKFIIRSEAGKMSIYIAWYKRSYPVSGKFVMIYPTQKMLDKGTVFDEDVFVLRKGKLSQLKKNVSNFFKEFQIENFHSLSSSVVSTRLKMHNLSDENILNDYYDKILNNKDISIVSSK